MTDRAPGDRLGPYTLMSTLGAGGMGVVYRADDPRLDRPVAIKVLAAELTRDAEAKRRFHQEAQAASRLDHPNICTIHEIDETPDGQLYLVMGYYEGATLRERIARGPLAVDEAVGIARQVAGGLSAAHDAGIVHRDVKPANLLITGDGVVKILDFGLAKLAGSEAVTRSSAAIGTVSYMSPEQTCGDEVDHRSDLWSLGAVVYEMLAGVPPFTGDNLLAISTAIRERDPLPLRARRADVPPHVERIVRRALSKRPDERPPTARDLAAAFGAAGQSVAAPARRSPAPSIAVLPFADMSAGRDQDYFCEGMAEEIITLLSRLDGVRVVARTSAFQFKGRSQDVRRIGDALGVTHVLEGSVRTSGDRLRVSAQLINVSDGYHVWSDRYDRLTTDVFGVQDEISASIAGALRLRLVTPPATPAGGRHTGDLDAYHLYLRGRHHWYSRDRGAIEQAIRCFEQAIEKAPTYALAHAGVAEAYTVLGVYGFLPPKVAFPKAKAAVDRALAETPELAEAYVPLGLINAAFDWDFAGADQALRRATELDPMSELAHSWRGIVLAVLGRHAEAAAACARARDIDPISAYTNAIAALVSCIGRHYDAALATIDTVLERDPDFLLALYVAGLSQIELGRFDAAIGRLEPAVRLSDRAPFYLGLLARAYALAGRRAEAEAIADELERRADREYIPGFAGVWIAIALDDADRAFALLERGYRERGAFLWTLPAPWFTAVRQDPRYDDLVRRVGFPAGTP